MASIFSVFKTVRPKQTIKSDDFNGLQNSLKTSLDSLGDALGAGAPAGHKGVSTPFHVGTPVDDEHAVNKAYVTNEFAALAAPELAKCVAEADRAEAEADRAEAIALGDISSTLDAITAQISWSVVTSDITLTANRKIIADSSASNRVFALPSSLTVGDFFIVHNKADGTGNTSQVNKGSHTFTYKGVSVGDDISLASGETLHLVVEDSSTLEIV